MNNKKRIILVLGIYRSGTSALTKGLETMGVSIVDQENTIFNSFNEKGYWEDLGINDFNMKLIASLEPLEHRLRSILPLSEKEVDFLCDNGFLKQGADLLLSRLSVLSQPLGLKDPRFCMVLPFWKRVFQTCNLAVSFVISLRNPLSTIGSMKAFATLCESINLNSAKFFWTWIAYMSSALEQTEGCDRLLVDYDELVKDPAREIERIAHVCQLEIIDERLQIYCDDFIDRSLCHFHGAEDHFLEKGLCRTFAVEMYEKLSPVAKGISHFQTLNNSLEKWREQLATAEAFLILVEKEEYEVKKIQKTLQEREQMIASLHAKVNEQMRSLASCYTTIHQRNLQIAALMQEKIDRSA